MKERNINFSHYYGFAVSMPGFVHAEQGMGLEEAIKFAKGLLEIPEDYEFNYG